MSELIASKLCKSYKKRQIVRAVSFTVRQGEIVGLLGPNGAGKTTSFYMVVGLIQADSGKIMLNNEDMTRLSIHQRAWRGLAYLPQEASIFRHLSVQDNIMAILEYRKDMNQTDRHEKLQQLLHDFNIKHIRNSMALSLSGGERRRIEIARTLALDPQFILLDEPFAGVDPLSVNDIQEIIRQLSQNHIGILITDHNVRETLSICQRAYILNDGSIIAEGKPRNLLDNEQVKQVYLGENFSL